MDEHTLVKWKGCHTVMHKHRPRRARGAQLVAVAMMPALALDVSWLGLTP